MTIRVRGQRSQSLTSATRPRIVALVIKNKAMFHGSNNSPERRSSDE